MPQANFAYSDLAIDPAGLPLALSIFADRAHLRAALRDDAKAAGFRIAEVSGVGALADGQARPLGEVVLVDCPEVDGKVLAALARLDVWAAHCGARLVVSTSVPALDDVFACLDQSHPQILVDPLRAERVIALGQVLAHFPKLRLRDLSEDDRLLLLRLTEQIGHIAQRLDGLSGMRTSPAIGDSAFRFEMPRSAFRGALADDVGRLADFWPELDLKLWPNFRSCS